MISLKTLLGDKFSHLVNNDRPDLQDNINSIGIEVTRAIREDKNVANALINEMAGMNVKEVDETEMNEINRSGYAYGLGSGKLMGKKEYDYWALALPMKRILKSKVEKVSNGFYGDFREFDLYVFTKENLEDNEIEEAIDYMKRIQNKFKTHYDNLFISQIQSMFVCDLNLLSYDKIQIDDVLRQSFYKNAIGIF